MTAILLSLGSALSFGSADYLGGVATRRVGGAIPVVVTSQLFGLATVALFAPLFPTDFTGADVAWGATAGVVGAIGLIALFRGFAVGAMSVVAPITAVGAAVVPFVFGIATGERPPLLAVVGAVVALVGVWLVSRPPDADEHPHLSSGVWEGVVAGIGFGVFFIFIRNTADASGLIPLVAARVTSISVVALVGLGLGRRVLVARRHLVITGVSGALDMVANALFLLAVRIGLLSIVSVLTSLYPAATLTLAMLVDHERVARSQLVGIGFALAGVAAIAAA